MIVGSTKGRKLRAHSNGAAGETGHPLKQLRQMSKQDDTMNLKHLFVAVPAALLILGNGAANAGQTINEAGALACVNDKWDEKEPEKGHKLVDYAGRCVHIPDDPAAPKSHGGLRGKVRVHA